MPEGLAQALVEEDLDEVVEADERRLPEAIPLEERVLRRPSQREQQESAVEEQRGGEIGVGNPARSGGAPGGTPPDR